MKVKPSKKESTTMVAPAACGGEGEGTVVVGVRMDAQSRELLTWALVKVAESGSRVVALHVITSSSLKSDPDGDSPSSMISLVKAFDSVLAVYEGFCNLKQIDLKLKICRGSSIRKVMVREVNGFRAAKLILGVTKQSRGTGAFSTSIAKYCAKKLPRECWVVAVNNGKIVFQREAAQESKGTNKDENSKFLNGNNGSYCLLPTEKVGVDGGSNIDSRLPSSINLSEQSCSICSHCGDTDQGCKELGEKRSLPYLPALKTARESHAVPRSAPASPDIRPGWPNIRRTFLQSIKSSKDLEKTKISVVQWAMRLPTRYSAAAAVHPDRKASKLDKKGSSDRGRKSVIPLAADATNPTDAAGGDEILELPKELEALQEKYASTCRLFTYQELANATSDFTDENLIGKGGTSRVYKGCLPDGTKLAVKILTQSEDALRELAMEVEIITTLSHQNIISLLGFSFGKNKLLLVYDLLSRGSLEENLHGVKSNKKFLGWTERYKIAVGVAEALDYLHNGSSSVIHRDVKSSNILLTEDFQPQLSDFGLATWASSASTQLTCNDVAGTFGYLAPEYFIFGKVNEKIDVYAFGVVLLELLSGRKPISNEFPKGQQSLVMWAKPNLQSGKGKLLLDPSLGDEYDDAQLGRMISAASLCIRRSPKLRPKMSLILQFLRGEDDAIKWARIQLGASEELEGLDEDATYSSTNNIQSHISLALLDVDDDDDMLSVSTTSHSVDYIMAHSSLEAYLHGRCSRSSSFD